MVRPVTKNTTYSKRKLLLLDPELDQAIENYRYALRVPSEAEAIRRLLRKALKLPEVKQ